MLLIIIPTLGKSPYLTETLGAIGGIVGLVKVVVVGPEAARQECLNAWKKIGLEIDFDFFTEPPSLKGLYEAINYALSQETSSWTHLTYINDDDLFGRQFRVMYDSVFRDKINADSFCYGRVRLIDGDTHYLGKLPTESKASYFEALLAGGISPLNQQGMLIPRALWDKLGGFRAEYKLCADLDFWLRAHRMGWPFKYYPLEVGQFRIREGQLSGDTRKLEAEIAAVVARDAPRKIGACEQFYARWQFRIKNLPIYIARFISGRRVRGMKLLAGK